MTFLKREFIVNDFPAGAPGCCCGSLEDPGCCVIIAPPTYVGTPTNTFNGNYEDVTGVRVGQWVVTYYPAPSGSPATTYVNETLVDLTFKGMEEYSYEDSDSHPVAVWHTTSGDWTLEYCILAVPRDEATGVLYSGSANANCIAWTKIFGPPFPGGSNCNITGGVPPAANGFHILFPGDPTVNYYVHYFGVEPDSPPPYPFYRGTVTVRGIATPGSSDCE